MDDRGDSTAHDPRPRLRRRFFAALVLIGFLFGGLLGRLMAPEPVRLLEVQAFDAGLRLRLDGQADYREASAGGGYTLSLQAEGREATGQLNLEGQAVRWRVQPGEQGLSLRLVALRPLQVRASAREEGGAWLLELRLATPAGER